MNQVNNSQMNEFEKAKQLRREAELLEYRGRVKARITQLLKDSKDAQYDQYLSQVMNDLESGKATPEQVEKDLNRTYAIYVQRMSSQQTQQTQQTSETGTVPVQNPAGPEIEKTPKKSGGSVEFKIGANILSVIGALFVLTAFVIFATNFLNGLGQGICLYVAALVLVFLSELLLSRTLPTFAHVITGIGVGGLYAANIANYMALHTISSLAAMMITLLIAAITIFISRKNDSTIIRLISLFGCYICFYPTGSSFSHELEFLVITLILLIVNMVGVIFQNQKNQVAINAIHLVMHLIFSIAFLSAAGRAGIIPEYMVLYIISSFIFINIFSLQQSRNGKNTIFVLSTIGNGICIFMLFIVGNFGQTLRLSSASALFVHLIAEVLIVVVSTVIFLLWNKEDGRKWAQLYYVATAILLLDSFSDYELERVISVLVVFALVKVLSGKKELIVLDCIVTVWTGIVGITAVYMNASWLCWLFAGALVLSLMGARRLHIFHEIVITLFTTFICLGYYRHVLLPEYSWMRGWHFPVIVALLLVFMLLCNHLPMLKRKSQRPYNVFVLVLMIWYYLIVFFYDNYLVSTVMMVLGAITIMIIFRKRYELEVRRKYLLLAGFLTYYSLTSHYESPVVVSILLMVIALACVGVGFKIQAQAERICGLIMAVFVCIKLVIYDFREVAPMYRVIVFMVVGVIALMISFIYIMLQKSEDKKRVEEVPSEPLASEPIPAVALAPSEEAQEEHSDGSQEHDGNLEA